MKRLLTAVLFGSITTLSACSSLSEEEQNSLNLYKQNSKDYYDKNDFLRCIDQCRKGLELDEDDPSLNLNLAYALMRQRRLSSLLEAERQFERIIDDENYGDERPVRFEYGAKLGLGMTRHQIGLKYDAKGESEQAQEAYTRAREALEAVRSLDPESKEVTLALSQAHASLGNYEGAIREIDHGLEQLAMQHDTIEKRIERGATLNNDLKTELIVNETRQHEFLALKAIFLKKLERHAEAIEQFDKIESIAPLREGDYYERGLLHERIGNDQAAYDDYSQFLKMSDRPLDEIVRDILRRKIAIEIKLGINEDDG